MKDVAERGQGCRHGHGYGGHGLISVDGLGTVRDRIHVGPSPRTSLLTVSHDGKNLSREGGCGGGEGGEGIT